MLTDYDYDYLSMYILLFVDVVNTNHNEFCKQVFEAYIIRLVISKVI